RMRSEALRPRYKRRIWNMCSVLRLGVGHFGLSILIVFTNHCREKQIRHLDYHLVECLSILIGHALTMFKLLNNNLIKSMESCRSNPYILYGVVFLCFVFLQVSIPKQILHFKNLTFKSANRQFLIVFRKFVFLVSKWTSLVDDGNRPRETYHATETCYVCLDALTHKIIYCLGSVDMPIRLCIMIFLFLLLLLLSPSLHPQSSSFSILTLFNICVQDDLNTFFKLVSTLVIFREFFFLRFIDYWKINVLSGPSSTNFTLLFRKLLTVRIYWGVADIKYIFIKLTKLENWENVR
ncbi:hypothetical protein L9F63_011962, partial [Diploptera punctata]